MTSQSEHIEPSSAPGAYERRHVLVLDSVSTDETKVCGMVVIDGVIHVIMLEPGLLIVDVRSWAHKEVRLSRRLVLVNNLGLAQTALGRTFSEDEVDSHARRYRSLRSFIGGDYGSLGEMESTLKNRLSVPVLEVRDISTARAYAHCLRALGATATDRRPTEFILTVDNRSASLALSQRLESYTDFVGTFVSVRALS